MVYLSGFSCLSFFHFLSRGYIFVSAVSDVIFDYNSVFSLLFWYSLSSTSRILGIRAYSFHFLFFVVSGILTPLHFSLIIHLHFMPFRFACFPRSNTCVFLVSFYFLVAGE